MRSEAAKLQNDKKKTKKKKYHKAMINVVQTVTCVVYFFPSLLRSYYKLVWETDQT